MDPGESRKRRKWDVPGPSAAFVKGASLSAQEVKAPMVVSMPSALSALKMPTAGANPGQPLDKETIARLQQGAAAVVEKINQDLMRKGVLPPGKGPLIGHQQHQTEEEKPLVREVLINDAPPPVRYQLTKRTTQDEIQRRTNTIIVTRGRYYAPGAPVDEKDPPLRLKISPGGAVIHNEIAAKAAIDEAAAEVQSILQGGRRRPGMSAAPLGSQYSNVAPPDQSAPHMHPLPAGASPALTTEATLYIGLEAPPEFNLSQRVRGQGDSFLQHIAKETGATVMLRGRGSHTQETAEPLHIYISCLVPKGLEEAQRLAANLIATVKADFQKAYPYMPLHPPAVPPYPYAHPQYLPGQHPYGAHPQPAHFLPPGAYRGPPGPYMQPPSDHYRQPAALPAYPTTSGAASPPPGSAIYAPPPAMPYAAVQNASFMPPGPGYMPYNVPPASGGPQQVPAQTGLPPVVNPPQQQYAARQAQQQPQQYGGGVSAQQPQQYAAGVPAQQPQQYGGGDASQQPQNNAASAYAQGLDEQEQEQENKRRRFREFKERRAEQGSSQPLMEGSVAPYQQVYEPGGVFRRSHAPSAQAQPSSQYAPAGAMAPPPPRQLHVMGPPPPRLAVRAAPQSPPAGSVTAGSGAGAVLPGLADYTDDE